MRVQVASIEHRSGVNFYLSNSEQGLWCQLVMFCEQCPADAGNLDEFREAATPRDKVEAYFRGNEVETLHMGTAELSL